MAEPDEPVVDFSTLEREKENITVNRTGHSALALQQTFSVPRNQRQQQLAAEKARFQQQLETAEEESLDPLEIYLKFVEWTIDSYPAGKSADSGLVPLLELATRTFKDDPRYKQDLRYLNLWFQYANVVAKPELIHAFLLANDIGLYYSTLYIEYAHVLELKGNRSKADEVFRLGIARKAKPLAVLQQRYNEFSTRMLSSHPGEPSSTELEAPVPPSFGPRKVLGDRTGIGRGATTQSTGTAAPRSGAAGNRGKIAVFVDGADNGDSQYQSNDWQKLDSQAALNKENTAEPSTWTDAQLRQAVHQTPRTPKFAVHKDLDEEDEARALPTKTPEHLAIRAPSQRPPTETELLVQNPFKNYDSPPSVNTAVEPHSSEVPLTQSRVSSSATSSSQAAPSKPPANYPKPRPFILPEPVPGRKPEKYRFKLDLLYNKGEEKEYSIAEVRAKSLGLLNKKWPQPDIPINTTGEYYEPTKTGGGKARMSVAREPTVTINTKFAMNDVFDMFNGEGGIEEEDDSFEGPDTAAKVPPTPNPFNRSTSSSERTPMAMKSSSSLSKFTPFVDPTPSTKTKPTPAFTPFHDAAPLGNGRPTSHTPAAIGRSVSGPAAAGPSTASKSNRLTPFVDPPASSTRAPLGTKLDAGPTPHRGTSFRPFVDSQDSMQIPATPTPTLDIKPARLFEIPASIQEEQPPPPKKASFNMFKDAVPPKTPATSTETMKKVSPPSAEPAGNIFTAPSRTALSPHSDALPPDGNQGAAWHPHPHFEDGQTQDDAGSSDWSEDGQEVPAAPPSVGGSEMTDSADEELEHVSDLPGSKAYKLNRFPQIDEMTPITERTYEFTRTSSDFTSHSRKSTVNPQQSTDELDVFGSSVKSRPRQSRVSLARPRQSMLPPTLDDTETTAGIPNPCNPYDESIISQLLDLIPVPFYDYRDRVCGKLDQLQRFGTKKLRSSTEKKRVSTAGETLRLIIGEEQFEVMEKLGEGGFGSVFLARMGALAPGGDDEEEDELIALKAVRPCQLWEYTILAYIRETVPQDLLPSIIEPKGLWAFQDESYLVLDHCPYGTLLDCLNRASGTELAASSNDTGFTELLVVFFTIELFKIVEGLHANAFIHGDLKIDNCLVRLDVSSISSPQYEPTGANGWNRQGLRLIDFGRAIDTPSFPEGQTFVGDWPPEQRDCVEHREGRPWTFETDYFGLAGIIHSMLFKKYIDSKAVTLSDGSTRYKITSPFKRYWNTDLWTRVFDLLLNPGLARDDGLLPVPDDLAKLRVEMEGWLVSNSARGLVRMLKTMARLSQ